MLLDAGASDVVGVTKLEFHLTGGSLNHTLIATATGTRYGWLANWNSTTVPDGTYTLQSVAYDAAGNQGGSTGVTIIVENTPPKPTINIPSNGSWVSGGVILDASAPANVGVTQVQFSLTGGSLNNVPIAQGGPTQNYGWLAGWSSTTVPDGTYTMQAEAMDGAGLQAVSKGVTVIVENSPPTTSILIPSSGSSVSGSQVVLDAGASLNVGVTNVKFFLTGGSLTNALVATAQPTTYGWLTTWNSTTVPNGTYTLQSEAFDGAGFEGFNLGVTVIVDNPPPTTSILISVERRLGVGIPGGPRHRGVSQRGRDPGRVHSDGWVARQRAHRHGNPHLLGLDRLLEQHDRARRHLHPRERSLRCGRQPRSESSHLGDGCELT